jgi:iron complex outermembrane receptor protein
LDPGAPSGYANHVDDDSFRTLMVTLARQNLRLQSFYSERTKGIPTGSYGNLFNDPRNRTLDRRSYVDVNYSRAINDRWSISARGYLDNYGYKGSYVYLADSGEPMVEKDYAVGTWWGGEVNATVASWKRHSITMGSEFRFNFRQDQGAYIIGNDVPEFLDRHDSNLWAVYVQDEYAIAKPLVLYLGVRHDRYNQFGGTTNPRLGAVYRPWINTAFKLIYGTAFRAPNAWELYYNASPYVGNPALKPSPSTASSVGFVSPAPSLPTASRN